GALHKLPFEALLLRAGDEPRYVLDDLPPLAYAPSVAILSLLTERRSKAGTGPLSLLTVANPAYPEPKETGVGAARPRRPDILGSWSDLPRLPGTARESEQIQHFFPPNRVKALLDTAATEKAVVAALPGKRVIHLAAHGLADERFRNMFGALVLTPPPPGPVTPDDDGLLTLQEIYTLPLKDCGLAALRARVTPGGPQQPLEAGVTLAGGFLAAGAHRVVASFWSVDDESTAALMERFFKEVTTAVGEGRPAAYLGALQQARQKVR